MSNKESYIIGIVIFLLLFLFIGVVFIAIAISDRDNNTSNSVQTGTFLSSCTTSSCNNGLICDGTNFTCRFPAGAPCSEFSDCVTGLICSGLCAAGATGSLNNLCPCSTGYQCILQENNLTLCKGSGGTTCGVDSDCVSALCEAGICATGAPNGFPCTLDIECSSFNCNIGFCQPFGATTGVIGSACSGNCVTFDGAICNNGPGMIPLACECLDGIGAPGTCVTAEQGILASCSQFAACGVSLVCYNAVANICTGTGSACICVFPYDDPNIQATGGICISGMTVGFANECFNNNRLGCDIGGQCINTSCGGQSVVAKYNFSNLFDTNLQTAFIGATQTSILPAFSGPIGIIQPYKLFSTSNGVVDTIYLVDSLQGLLSIQYDTNLNIILSPWIINIPHITTIVIGTTTIQRVLIDVGYNGFIFLVAFDETVVGTTIQNDTVYSGVNLTNLTPFNVLSGPGFTGLTGTQYTTGGVALSIDYIDISQANDAEPIGNDVLISINGTIYVKQNFFTTYSIGIIIGGPLNGTTMSGLTGPARFYFDNTENAQGSGPPLCPGIGQDNPIQCQSYKNIAFVGPFTSFSATGTMMSFDQVLQFSGNIASVAIPSDRFDSVQYKVFDFSIFSPTNGTISGATGMQGAGVIMLANAFTSAGILIDTVVAGIFGGATTIFPYRIGNSSRSVATANAFYIISTGSCD